MHTRAAVLLLLTSTGAGCASSRVGAEHDHPVPMTAASAAPAAAMTSVASLAPSSQTAATQLATSSRHGEWVMIPAGQDSVRAYVVYPERSTNAPVVVVVHEIFGLSTWVRSVADQLAEDGFIAIAPDLLTGKVTLVADTVPADAARSAIRTLNADDVHRQLAAVGQYGMSLPSAVAKYGIVGFCWGGGTSFEHAVRSPVGLSAAVVYYGPAPDTSRLASVRVPVLGLYGGADQRISAQVPATKSVMDRLGKSYDAHVFEGAGHGFLRAQEGRAANKVAADQAWPLTLAFFRRHLGS